MSLLTEVQRDQYNIEQQTRILGCAITKVTHSDTGLEMCSDSTVLEYIPCIHYGSQFVAGV